MKSYQQDRQKPLFFGVQKNGKPTNCCSAKGLVYLSKSAFLLRFCFCQMDVQLAAVALLGRDSVGGAVSLGILMGQRYAF